MPSVCVRVVSVSAPKPKTALSLLRVKSSPTRTSSPTVISLPKVTELAKRLETAAPLPAPSANIISAPPFGIVTLAPVPWLNTAD